MSTKRTKPTGSSEQNLLRVALFGGRGAGKTSMAIRVSRNEFIGDTRYRSYMEDRWDCVLGDTHLRAFESSTIEVCLPIVKMYAVYAHAALLLVDLTNKPSLEDAKQCIEVFAEERDPVHNPLPLVLVGTKTDLESERQLTPEEMKAFADTLGVPYIEASAKTGEGVREAFEEAAKIAINNNSVVLEGNKNKRCAIQ